MRPLWYAVLFEMVASCTEPTEREDKNDALRAKACGLDAGLAMPCSADDFGGDAGVDAAAPGAQVSPRCDVVLTTLTEDDADRAVISSDSGDLILAQWAENRTARPQVLHYRAACGGPLMTGLGSYDARNACLAGRCMGPAPATGTVLAPGERVRLGVAYVQASPDTCNREGLATGRYEVGYQLFDLTGAAVCTEPLHLTVH